MASFKVSITIFFFSCITCSTWASSSRDLLDFGTSYTYPVRLQGLSVPVSSGGWDRGYRAKLRKPLLADSSASLADLQQLSVSPNDLSEASSSQELAPIAYGEDEPIIIASDQGGSDRKSSASPLSYEPSHLNPGSAYANLVAEPASYLKPVRVATGPTFDKSGDGSQAYKYKLGYGFAQKTKYGLQGIGSIANRGYGSSSGTEAGYDTSAEKLPLRSFLNRSD